MQAHQRASTVLLARLALADLPNVPDAFSRSSRLHFPYSPAGTCSRPLDVLKVGSALKRNSGLDLSRSGRLSRGAFSATARAEVLLLGRSETRHGAAARTRAARS